jgi:hypothetical protein
MRTPKPPALSITSMADPMEGAYGVASAEGKDEDVTESTSTSDDPIELAMQQDPSSQSVQAADVVCGRGKMAFNHGTEIFRSSCDIVVEFLYLTLFVRAIVEGNKRFRAAVAQSAERYTRESNLRGKPVVVQSIIDEVHNAGGRFLKRDRHQRVSDLFCVVVDCEKPY